LTVFTGAMGINDDGGIVMAKPASAFSVGGLQK
jgi:hypothetical protein